MIEVASCYFVQYHKRVLLTRVGVSMKNLSMENHTENIKEGFTENYTETMPVLFRNAKNLLTYHISIQTKYHFQF